MQMDSRLKERLIGAAVLVVIGVWLIPWILDGPEPLPEADPDTGTLQLPADQESAPVRTQTIDLAERRGTTTRSVALPPAGDRHADATNAASRASAAPPQDVSPAERQDVSQDVAQPLAASEPARAADARSEPASTDAGPDGSDGPAADERIEVAQADTPDEPADEVREARDAGPASAPAAQPKTGDWIVQLGSFGEEANAARLAERVSTYGYQAEVSTHRASGRLMHRVRVGPHETRNQADAVASSLAAHGFVAQVVPIE
jgi:DedD protein